MNHITIVRADVERERKSEDESWLVQYIWRRSWMCPFESHVVLYETERDISNYGNAYLREASLLSKKKDEEGGE